MPRVCPGAAAEGSKALNDVRVVNESQVQSKEIEIFDGRIFTGWRQTHGPCPCRDATKTSAGKRELPTRHSASPDRPCSACGECAAPAKRIPAAACERGRGPA